MPVVTGHHTLAAHTSDCALTHHPIRPTQKSHIVLTDNIRTITSFVERIIQYPMPLVNDNFDFLAVLAKIARPKPKYTPSQTHTTINQAARRIRRAAHARAHAAFAGSLGSGFGASGADFSSSFSGLASSFGSSFTSSFFSSGGGFGRSLSTEYSGTM